MDKTPTLAYFLLGINLDSIKGWMQLCMFVVITYAISYIAAELSGFHIGIIAVFVVLLRIFLAANTVAKWHLSPIAELQSELEIMATDVATAQANFEILLAEKERAVAALQKSQADLKRAIDAMSTYIAERDSAEQTASELQARIEDLKAKAKQTEAQYSTRIAELNQQVSELQAYYNATQRLQQYKPLYDCGLTARKLVGNTNIANSISKMLSGAGLSSVALFDKINNDDTPVHI